MKKTFCVLLGIVAMLACFCFCGCSEQKNDEYLRIHIRADSNSTEDQAVKYAVKDEVVNFLTPLLAEADTKEKAKAIVLQNKSEIEKIANGVLKTHGFDYFATSVVKRETFPTRAYGDLTLAAGEYDALIVNLGSGSGDNWWCVVYPPLCFVGGEATGGAIRYRSALLEIIKKFFG